VARLSPRRAYQIGFLRAKRQARKQMHAIAREWETELALLQDDLHEMAVEYRQRLDVEQAIVERGSRSTTSLREASARPSGEYRTKAFAIV